MNTQKIHLFKAMIIALIFSMTASQTLAQTNNGIFFQAVARDNFYNPAKDRQIYVESSIIQTTSTGTKVLIELHKTTTDAMGVFSINLGNGTRTGGSASSLGNVDWSKGPFFLNLKIAITPFSASDNWNYTKELVDMGTTSFGTVPFALYSASSAKVDNKLDANDTTAMLKAYAKAVKVQSLETAVASKLTAADTLTMLAPYAKAAYTIDSSFFKSQLATKLNIADTIFYTKQKYTDSVFAKKLNIADTIFYTKQKYTDSVFAKKLNIADTIYYSKQKYTDSVFAKKLNIADSTLYVTKSQLASYNFSSGGSGVTIDTSSLSNRINLKASKTEMSSAVDSLNTKIVTGTVSIASNTASITSNAAAINIINNKIASSTASITANTLSINELIAFVTDQSITVSAADETITNNLTANTNAINTINTKVLSNTASITSNINSIASEVLMARAAELTLTNNLASNTSSISTITSSINNLNTNVVSNISSINSLNTTITAATSSNTLSTIVKRDASGNFSAGTINATSINAPIYASTPQSLIDASTISWNPTLGLNASVTLAGNRTLSFSSTPVAGSYGTLVVTQDGTGGRTLILPSTTNLVLGSSSTTNIALSAAANAKDILNFYYDGTNCYWNIGQGYGAAATPALTLTTTGTGAATLSGTTLNIPLASSTVNAGSISGTIAVANGGTGQSTIAGIQSTLGLAGTKVAIGATSGQTSQGSGAVAVGNAAGNSNQGSQSVAIGYVAGQANQGANSVAIGSNAAQGGQGTQSVAIGIAANSAANNATGIGAFSSAGFSNSTAIGYQAGTTAANTIQLGADGVTVVGSTAITNVRTSGTLTAGTVTYPNTHGTTGQVLSTTGSGTLTWTTASAGAGSAAHTVGEVYGGGIVFYITTGGLHGLIAETYNYGNATPEQGSDIATNPSYHSTNGALYTDWRLPTYYELSLLYTARNTTGLNMNNGVYVSSTYIWSVSYPYKCLNFSNGTVQQSGGNWDPQNVRAIRSF
jgi:hypothetical protein